MSEGSNTQREYVVAAAIGSARGTVNGQKFLADSYPISRGEEQDFKMKSEGEAEPKEIVKKRYRRRGVRKSINNEQQQYQLTVENSGIYKPNTTSTQQVVFAYESKRDKELVKRFFEKRSQSRRKTSSEGYDIIKRSESNKDGIQQNGEETRKDYQSRSRSPKNLVKTRVINTNTLSAL